jgi:hypothetical protein
MKKYKLNKTCKANKQNKYNYSIKNNNILKGGNFFSSFLLDKERRRINNIFKNFIVKLVKKSIPYYCTSLSVPSETDERLLQRKNKAIYTEGTKLWNQIYTFSMYTSFLDSTNIYSCKNVSCGISKKELKKYLEENKVPEKKKPPDQCSKSDKSCSDNTLNKGATSIKYKSIELNKCINNLFVQTVIKNIQNLLLCRIIV